MAATEIAIRIDDDEDLRAAHEAADSVGVDILESPGEPPEGPVDQIVPIVAVLIGAGVLGAGKFIMTWWEKRRGGLVIDLRPDAKDQIYRDHDVPWGYIVVFPADGGEVKIETKDEPKDSIERLIDSVTSGVIESAKAVADAAKDAVGAGKVEQKPAGAAI
jgi:hypothetical protein